MNDTTEMTALSRTIASTETLQLAELHALDAFYTPIEQRFERLTRLGKHALSVPVIAITAITNDTQWFKSVLGWNVSELPLDKSLCGRVVSTGKAVMVPDLSKNLHYANHPLVVNAPSFRFYCGMPLRNAKGTVIGTLCVGSRKPRRISDNDKQLLSDLAELAERELLTVALHDAQTQLISKLSIARRQALLDPLTKTWNRRGGMMLVEEAMAHARKDDRSIAVLAIDIDDFKKVNDRFGHAAGDSALRMVARELLACVREGDGVCRMGGDEFFVVLSNTTRDNVGRIAERLQGVIKRNLVTVKGGRKAPISVSVGIAYADQAGSLTAEELLSQADIALYENKMRECMRVDLA